MGNNVNNAGSPNMPKGASLFGFESKMTRQEAANILNISYVKALPFTHYKRLISTHHHHKHNRHYSSSLSISPSIISSDVIKCQITHTRAHMFKLTSNTERMLHRIKSNKHTEH